MDSIIFNWLLLWFLIIPQALTDDINIKTSESNAEFKNKFEVLFMEANTTYNFTPSKRGFLEKHFNTYCYRGEPQTLGRLLESIELQLEIDDDDYTQYEGVTPAEVEEHYTQHRSIFSLNLFTQKRSRLSLSPFMQQCIGIETMKPYNVTLRQQKVDFYRSIQLLSGITIFLFAGILSTNTLFYYITGILFGICSSFLLLIWLSGKLMPKRTMMYGVLIGGWTVGVYMIRMLWDNIQMIMLTYRNYVCWYIIITGLVSFCFCYRLGPPKNRRSKNIIKWLLQLMSLVTIYYSSNFKEATIALMFVTVIIHYFPRVLKKTKNVSTSARISGECLNQTNDDDDGNGNNRVKELTDDFQQWSLNSHKTKEAKITQRSRASPSANSDREQDLTPNEQKFDTDCKAYSDDDAFDTDISFEEDEIKKQKLYPLPDGSFLLSEKRPIIIKPQPITPVYHRSTPLFSAKDEQDEDDYTPKNHLATHSRRLSVAVSTSNLLFADDGSRVVSSPPSLRRRSSSARRMQSCSPEILDSSKIKHGSSSPEIQVENPTVEDHS